MNCACFGRTLKFYGYIVNYICIICKILMEPIFRHLDMYDYFNIGEINHSICF